MDLQALNQHVQDTVFGTTHTLTLAVGTETPRVYEVGFTGFKPSLEDAAMYVGQVLAVCRALPDYRYAMVSLPMEELDKADSPEAHAVKHVRIVCDRLLLSLGQSV